MSSCPAAPPPSRRSALPHLFLAALLPCRPSALPPLRPAAPPPPPFLPLFPAVPLTCCPSPLPSIPPLLRPRVLSHLRPAAPLSSRPAIPPPLRPPALPPCHRATLSPYLLSLPSISPSSSLSLSVPYPPLLLVLCSPAKHSIRNTSFSPSSSRYPHLSSLFSLTSAPPPPSPLILQPPLPPPPPHPPPTASPSLLILLSIYLSFRAFVLPPRCHPSTSPTRHPASLQHKRAIICSQNEQTKNTLGYSGATLP